MARMQGQTATVKHLWLKCYRAIEAADQAIETLIAVRAGQVEQLSQLEQLAHPDAIRRLKAKYDVERKGKLWEDVLEKSST